MGLGNFISNAVKAVGSVGIGDVTVKSVTGEISDAVKKATNEIAKVPVLGPIVGVGTHIHIVNAVNEIARGQRVDQAALGLFKNKIKDYKDVAPYAASAVSFIPGIGQGVGAGIMAGAALAEGKPLTQVAIEAIKGSIPGGPVAAAAFSAAQAAAEGKPIDQIAISALPIGPKEKQALTAGLALAKDIAAGKSIDQALLARTDDALKILAPELKNAITIGTSVGNAKAIQAAIIKEITTPEAKNALLHLGQAITANDEVYKAAKNLIPSPTYQRGFDLAVGLMNGKSATEIMVAGLREGLSGDEQKGFDTAVAEHIGRSLVLGPKGKLGKKGGESPAIIPMEIFTPGLYKTKSPAGIALHDKIAGSVIVRIPNDIYINLNTANHPEWYTAEVRQGPLKGKTGFVQGIPGYVNEIRVLHHYKPGISPTVIPMTQFEPGLYKTELKEWTRIYPNASTNVSVKEIKSVEPDMYLHLSTNQSPGWYSVEVKQGMHKGLKGFAQGIPSVGIPRRFFNQKPNIPPTATQSAGYYVTKGLIDADEAQKVNIVATLAQVPEARQGAIDAIKQVAVARKEETLWEMIKRVLFRRSTKATNTMINYPLLRVLYSILSLSPVRSITDFDLKWDIAESISNVTDSAHEQDVLVRIAYFESDFRRSVVNCTIKGGKGKSLGIFQVKPITKNDFKYACGTVDEQVQLAFNYMHRSFEACPGNVGADLLAMYVSGTCVRGIKEAKHRWGTQ